MIRCALLFALIGLNAACTAGPAYAPADKVWRGPDVAGRIEDADLNESSGLVASHRDPDLLWSHNDSGGEPVLFALTSTGAPRGRVRVAGVANIDWEDMAAFTWHGQTWLLIADVGDNLGGRTDCRLHIIAEPDPTDLDPDKELTVPVAWSLPVHYADGIARDCEAVAVDVPQGMVYLLSKRERPAGLYQLPLFPDLTQPPPTAKRVAAVIAIPQPQGLRAALNLPTGRWSGQPVAMDFAPDGSAAAVLTYVSVLIFPRKAGETWAETFTREPAHLLPFLLPQAEAVGFSADGRSLFVSTEGKQSPLLRYTLADTP